jgi:hypothetical protein
MPVFRVLVDYQSALRYVLYSTNRVIVFVIVNSEEINDLSNRTKKELSMQSNSLPPLLYHFVWRFYHDINTN